MSIIVGPLILTAGQFVIHKDFCLLLLDVCLMCQQCLIFFLPLWAGWFGIRKDFCQFLLGVCPCLQEYGNISYSLQHNDTESGASTPECEKVKGISRLKREVIDEQPKAVVPVLSIETPD